PGTTMFRNSPTEQNRPTIYEDYFISCVYEDKEGNILLSTFDKGVIVIPDLSIPDVISSFRGDPVTALHTDGGGGLLLGSSKGKLMRYSGGTLSVLSDEGKRSIEAIYGSPESGLAIF